MATVEQVLLTFSSPLKLSASDLGIQIHTDKVQVLHYLYDYTYMIYYINSTQYSEHCTETTWLPPSLVGNISTTACILPTLPVRYPISPCPAQRRRTM